MIPHDRCDNWKIFSMNSLGEIDFVPEWTWKRRIEFGVFEALWIIGILKEIPSQKGLFLTLKHGSPISFMKHDLIATL